MRPRSRLLAKRRLQLPTITEGYEDMVRDMNYANSLHAHALSSEDYLLSICQLARPTFPSQDSSFSCDIISARQQDSLQQRLWLPRLVTHNRRHTTSDPNYREDAHEKDVCDQGERRDSNTQAVLGCHGASDPLEYLYGHQNNPAPPPCESGSLRQRLADGRGGRSRGERSEQQTRPRAYSFPRCPPVPIPNLRKSSSLKLRPPVSPVPPPTGTVPSLPHPSSQQTLQSRPATGEREGEKERSLVSGWICDCRAAWRQGHHQACVLPAIAEM